MAFDNPAILKESIGSLIVSKVYTLAGILDHVTSTWISSGAISDEFLQIRDVIRCNYKFLFSS